MKFCIQRDVFLVFWIQGVKEKVGFSTSNSFTLVLKALSTFFSTLTGDSILCRLAIILYKGGVKVPKIFSENNSRRIEIEHDRRNYLHKVTVPSL